MEELIEIIIRMIIRMMQGPKPVAPPQRRAIPAPTPVPPIRRGKPPLARRAPGKRMAPPPISLAKPIMMSPGQVVSAYNPAAPVQKTSPTPAPQPPAVKPSATAQTLNRWLNPTTLRQQFIITEIFQPPLALRQSSTPSEML
jgi:hypothetical protein